ncbi:MAG TPA: hypothetical protein VFQ45_12975 [Longimicrobium sp.]|nr:hypothetical protein [Longimicrobium sp.]
MAEAVLPLLRGADEEVRLKTVESRLRQDPPGAADRRRHPLPHGRVTGPRGALPHPPTP